MIVISESQLDYTFETKPHKQPIKNAYGDMITKEEILNIDNRVKFAYIENPNVEEYDFEYYVKIWFNYILFKPHDEKKIHIDGRKEFVSENKEGLIEKINVFLNQDNPFKII
jgi:hypothetical protein